MPIASVESSRFQNALESGRCYIVAEAGSNHNGEFALARQLIEIAAAADADAVKFQLFRAASLYPPAAGNADYLVDATDIYEVVKRMEMPTEWLPQLRELCLEADLDLLVTPFDEASADAIEPYVPIYKIASYELTHEPLIRHIAAKGRPIIMSTGAAAEDEVESALGAAREAGAREVVLLQCTAAYPARLEALNVAAVAGLRRRFGVPTGLSDHSTDPVIAPVLAVGLGAVAIEKHFTIDRTMEGPDHRFALEPDQLGELVRAVRAAESARGEGLKVVHPDEEELRLFARRAVFAVRDLAAGEQIDESAVAVLRRGKRGDGLPPASLPSLIGRRTARAVASGSPLRPDDLES